jgi:hypothetical protein
LIRFLIAAMVAAAPPRPVLRVNVDPDSSLPCPAGTAVVQALRARLPRVLVETEGPSTGQDLAVSLTPNAQGWELAMHRADGSLALHRDLRPGECSEAADTAALIVERYLDDIEWPGRPVTLNLLAKPDGPASPTTPGPTLEIEAGVAGRIGMWPGGGAPGVSAEIGSRVIAHLRVSLWGEWSPLQSRSFTVGGNSPVAGVVTLQTMFAAFTGGYCGELGPAVGCASIVAGAAILRGSSRGTVYRADTATDVLPALGAALRLTVPIAWKLAATLELTPIAPLGTATFQVEDYPQAPHLESSALDLVGSLRLAAVF